MEKVCEGSTVLILGYKKRKCKPWISNELRRLTDERRELKSEGTKSERLMRRWRADYRCKTEKSKKNKEPINRRSR